MEALVIHSWNDTRHLSAEEATVDVDEIRVVGISSSLAMIIENVEENEKWMLKYHK